MTEETKKALYDICNKYDDLLIIDVMNYLHRYMWVHQSLTITVGDEIFNTGHLYGFTRLMTYLKDKFHNCAIVLALDGIDRKRREINSGYKATRDHSYRVDSEMNELLYMCGLVDGVYSVLHDDYEADDVMNVVSKRVRELCIKNSIKKNIYILSNDKDMFQCVRDDEQCPIHIIKKFGNDSDSEHGADIVDENSVRDKFNGVGPKDIVKFRAITGDSSDNLRGYYRFRKANAAIIAENFDYNEDEKVLELKEGVKPCLSWKKFLPTVFGDMKTFIDNYDIMKLKEFDFEIKDIGSKDNMADVREVVEVIKKYELTQFLNNVSIGNYSKYRREIREILRGY